MIHERSLLDCTIKTGQVVRTRLFRMHYLTGEGPPGLAFLAGRRVGGAVQRNRARRVLREAFRTSETDLAGIATLVLVATDLTARAPHTEIKAALDAALKQVSDRTG
jgi:ribonuclease P protein component